MEKEYSIVLVWLYKVYECLVWKAIMNLMALDNHDLRVTTTKPRLARLEVKPKLIMPLKNATTAKQHLNSGRKVRKNFG